MSSVTALEFLALYDEFEVLGIDKVQAVIDYAERNYCSAKSWGGKQRDGIMLVAAHALTMQVMQTSEMIGSTVSVARGQGGRSGSPADNDFQLTTYGRQYLALRKTLPKITGFAI